MRVSNYKLRFRVVPVLVFTLMFVAAIGCGGGPDAIALPDFDPSDAAERAMELYDTNKDGYVAGDELAKAPGLNAALKTLDTDGDGKVSETEVADRVRAWINMSIGLMTFSCDVLLDGRPLEGATVTFEPEAFLGDAIQAAVGTTALGGRARPKIPKENRPSPDSPPGVQAGLYKVKITLPAAAGKQIPAKYNEETILGQEVSKDDWAIANKRVIFKLESR